MIRFFNSPSQEAILISQLIHNFPEEWDLNAPNLSHKKRGISLYRFGDGTFRVKVREVSVPGFWDDRHNLIQSANDECINKAYHWYLKWSRPQRIKALTDG